MCGIIAGLSLREGLGDRLWSGLKQLEYRGYDSFGMAYNQNGEISVLKDIGAPSEYEMSDTFSFENITSGIGHTRWATHGGVCQRNAHPHVWVIQGANIALVHNGVVENFMQLKNSLPEEYVDKVQSDTDSEYILAHIAWIIDTDPDINLAEAITEITDRIIGSFSIVVANLSDEIIYAIKKDFSLMISASSSGHILLASDLCAFQEDHHHAFLMKDSDLVIMSLTDSLEKLENIFLSLERIALPKIVNSIPVELKSNEKSMLFREIMQQIDLLPWLMQNITYDIDLSIFEEIHFIGCGSSYHAGWFAAELNIAVNQVPSFAYIASEFCENPPPVTRPTILVALSQSGETADLLVALKHHRYRYQYTVAFCNRPHAMIENLVDRTFQVDAGPEFSVASTKVFTAQIIHLSRFLKVQNRSTRSYFQLSNVLSDFIESINWKAYASSLSRFSSILILARGVMIPIAYEGALKMRELTYKHVHAFPSGELKHGTLSLIDERVIVIILSPADRTDLKQSLIAQEVRARGGSVLMIIQEGSSATITSPDLESIMIPMLPEIQTAIFFSISFQLLALECALLLGHNPDRPRNLAKSVTVE